jgi:hypothetical protein
MGAGNRPGESRVDPLEQAEQQEGNDDRQGRENCAGGPSPKACPNQSKILHGSEGTDSGKFMAFAGEMRTR